MITRGRGVVVNVSTAAASAGLPGAPVYGATKAALESLTRSWAAAFGHHGVRVNAVAPGPTRTDAALDILGDGVDELGSKTALAAPLVRGRLLRRLSFRHHHAPVISPARHWPSTGVTR